MTNHKLTVLMPVYNAESFLKQAIESILYQSFKDFLFIIINDGSTDRSEEIILSYKDDRIIYKKHAENLGLVYSLNEGIDLAESTYLIRMDADDISLSDRFEKQYYFMENNTDVAICGTWFETFGSSSEIIQYPTSHEEIFLAFLLTCPIGHPTTIIRSKILKENKLYYNPEFKHSEDTNLWIRIADYGKFANIPEVLLRYRIHDDQITSKHQNYVNLSFNKSRNLHFKNICLKLDQVADIKPFPTEYILPFESIKKLETRLKSLIESNNQLKVFNVDTFKKTMSKLWILILSSQDICSFYELKYLLKSQLIESGLIGAKYKALLLKKFLTLKFRTYTAHWYFSLL